MFDLSPFAKLVASLLLIGVFTATRILLVHLIRKRSQFISPGQRRWINLAKNGVLIFIVLGLLAIWSSELRQFVLSVTAFVIALVIATKELILCFSGYFLKTSSGAFSVGDWVEIGDTRGEVIDQNPFATTIQEVQGGNRYDYTGRTVTLPNSIFLTASVKNLNFMRRYVFHTFTVNLPVGTDPTPVRKLILERAIKLSESFIEVARRYNQLVENRAGIDIPGPDPRVSVTTNNDGKLVFTTTLFCPTDQAVEIEQAILRDVLTQQAHANKPTPAGETPV